MRFLLSCGANGNGQLGCGGAGMPMATNKLQLIDFPANAGDIVDAAAGDFHSIAITSEGWAFAWGLNKDGQVGVDPASQEKVGLPTRIQSSHTFRKCAGGTSHTMLLSTDGNVFVCGAGCGGEHGSAHLLRHVPIDEKIDTIAAGRDTCVAISDVGTMYGWGAGFLDIMGSAATSNSGDDYDTPKRLQVGPPGTRVAKAAPGHNHIVFLTQTGDVIVSGSNTHSQLGQGSTVKQIDTWKPLRFAHNVRDVCVGQYCSWMAAADGQPSMMGTMDCGVELLKRYQPSFLRPSLWECTGLATGKNHTVMWTSAGTLHGIGRNHRGQLGHTANDLGISTFIQIHLPDSPSGATMSCFGAKCGTAHTLILASDEHLVNMGFFVHADDDVPRDGEHGDTLSNSCGMWREDISNMSFIRGRNPRNSFANSSRQGSSPKRRGNPSAGFPPARNPSKNRNTPVPWWKSHDTLAMIGVGAAIATVLLLSMERK